MESVRGDETLPGGASKLLSLDGCLIDQHDGDVVLHRIHPATVVALQALGILPILEGPLARWTNQHLQQVFSNHENALYAKQESLTTEAQRHRVNQEKCLLCFAATLWGAISSVAPTV